MLSEWKDIDLSDGEKLFKAKDDADIDYLWSYIIKQWWRIKDLEKHVGVACNTVNSFLGDRNEEA